MSIPDTVLGSVLADPPQPVIPDYGEPDECVRANGEFCLRWFLHEWPSIFAPALIQHIQLSALAVIIGFTLAFFAALTAQDRKSVV